jgi:predicted transcriptional regulator of viral defense system
MVNNITFKGLGPREAELVARLTYERKRIVTAQDLSMLFPSNYKYRNQFIYTLKKKNILSPVKRGVYVFTPLEALHAGPKVNEFLIPPVFFPKGNYYIGYSTMFNYYGFSEQLYQTVHVLNTSICCERSISGVAYKFIKITADRMYGIDTIEVDGSEVKISSREKTLVDMIYFNKPVGGVINAVDILKSQVEKDNCEIKKLVEYSSYFPNASVRKRIGVALEGLGIKDLVLKTLIKSVEGTSISSLTGSRKGELNKKWRVIVDASQK